MASNTRSPVLEGVKPVLSLQLGNISKLSPNGRESLVYMWTVFSKCRGSIQDGQRLENLSWRLWYEDLRIAGSSPLSDPESDSDSSGASFDSDSEDDLQAPHPSVKTGREISEPALPQTSCPRAPARRAATVSIAVDNKVTQPGTPIHDAGHPSTSSSRESSTGKVASSLIAASPAPADVILSGSGNNTASPSAASTAPAPDATAATPTCEHNHLPAVRSSPSHSRSSQTPSGHMHTRRSSCPPPNDRQQLSSSTSNTSSQAHQPPKKEKRAYSFVNNSAPRIRTHSQITPCSLQHIIGTVIPMDFKTSPPICCSSTTSMIATSAKQPSPTVPVALETVVEDSPAPSLVATVPTPPLSTTQPIQSILKRTTSPPQERAPSVQSDRSYQTSSSTMSSPPVDHIFSLPPADANAKPQSVDSTVSAPNTSAASSMTVKDFATTGSMPMQENQNRRLSVPQNGDSSIHASSSSHRLARPAMARNKSSTNRVSRTALQRTQSAKSVRIIESPTNEDDGDSGHHKPPSTSHKKVPSSSRLKAHGRVASSSNLHSQRAVSSSDLAASGAKDSGAKAISMKRSSSKDAQLISVEPRSVSKGFETGPVSTTAASSMQSTANNNPFPPQNSPISPAAVEPASVVLPPQPRPSPADPRFQQHSTMRRPSSPTAPSPVIEEASPVRTTSRKASQQQVEPVMSTRARQASEPAAIAPQQTAAAAAAGKKKGMFFLSSPTTDSDDEFGPSAGRKKAMAASPLAAFTEPPAKLARPTQTSPQVKKTAKAEESDDEDAFDDEDGSDWSSEMSDSEEDERQAAIRAEEAREKDMFAKRVPSQIGGQGGLLSKLLHPEEYARGSANLPVHLRNNRSAIELTRTRPSGKLQGLDRSNEPMNATVTVTGMQSSKSTAALSGMGNRHTLVPTKSGNHLTRLGGAPQDADLESDDDDDEEGTDGQSRKITPTQHERLATLMQRTKSSGQIQKAAPAASAIAEPVRVQGATAYTPRTTRRNMLSTELTESLRVNLILERQSRSRGAMAGLGGVMQNLGNRLSGKGLPSPPPPPPPAVQRGSENFATSRVDDAAPPRSNPSSMHMRSHPPNGSPLPNNIRRNSDPSANQREFYSPGFHHVGW